MSEITEQLVRINALFTYYDKELDASNLLSSRKTSQIASSSLILFAATVVFAIWSIFSDNKWLVLICLLSAVTGIVFGIISLKSSKKYIIKSYPEYEPLVGNKLSNYQTDFIKAYRCDKISEKIRELGLDKQLDGIIEYFERKGDASRLEKWWPITIGIAVAFPVWNEFVGKVLDFSIGGVAFLIIAVTVMYYVTAIMNMLLKTLYLSQVNKYKSLAETLKILKFTFEKE